MNKIYYSFSLLLALCLVNHAQAQTLLHYWDFNNSASISTLLTPTNSITTPQASLVHLAGGSSTVETTSNTTGQGFENTNFNARNGSLPGSHLRFNLPIGGKLVYSLPTTGFQDVVVKYITRRSGSGAGTQVITYSIDGSNYLPFTTINPVDGNPALVTLDFSSLTNTDNNPNFKIKLEFEQGGGGTAGNNRIDNFTAEGTVLGPDLLAPSLVFNPINNSSLVATSTKPSITFNEDIRLVDNTALDNSNVDATVELRLNNASGSIVPFDAVINGRVISITPNSELSFNQRYYVALKSNTIEDLNNNAITTTQAASFTTALQETQFTAGDIAFVAYRMNASNREDEFAFLSFVDILPGTRINFTDAKYTSNAQAQCPNSIVWTAPNSGISAGTVVVIQNDGGTASLGTVTGSTFGLSSGGDQVIAYTGTAANPNYLAALSSNAWATSNTSCSGSFSLKPSGLVDGFSAINLSTTNGNTSGNAVNAYYTGAQTGTNAQLRASILNPSNWIALGSGTLAQTWPNWTFPGPPSVIKTLVVNQNTLKVVFSGDLENSSASDRINYKGIDNLAAAVLSNNGILNDTVTLIYSTPFALNQNNTLRISEIKDNENRKMVGTYSFTFNYSPKVSFAKRFESVKEEAGFYTLRINIENPVNSSFDLVMQAAPFSNTSAEDHGFSNQTITLTGNSTMVDVKIPINNDGDIEQDEYMVFTLENLNGISATGGKYFTLFIKDNDKLAPNPNKEIALKHINSFDPSVGLGSTAEIVAYDSASRRIFVSSSIQKRIEIGSLANPASPQAIKSIDMAPYGGNTSVAVRNGILAVAAPNANEQANGSVVFFDLDGNFLKQVTVGALPDMITFTPDGKYLLTANEGQPNSAYTVDPEGSVSLIDFRNGIFYLDQADVTTLSFSEFNSREAELIASGVRKTKASSTLAQDFEPEFITVKADGTKAWVTLQENNAIGEIDLIKKRISNVWALGTKDVNSNGNGFDASDRSNEPIIANWPLNAYYMPDAMGNYSVNGVNYIVTANEGDEKEYAGLTERAQVNAINLDPAKFPNSAWLKEDQNLGRYRVTNLNGDTDGDGDFDKLFCVGSRSFSIFNADDNTMVYDSGDDFEQYTSKDKKIGPLFNSDHENNGIKGRSRSKGPEPEGLAIGQLAGETYAFVALERIGGLMVYNISKPEQPVFVDYANTRTIAQYGGDLGPEGVVFISPSQSPNGKAYVLVANEISGTITIYEILYTPISLGEKTVRAMDLEMYPNPVGKNSTVKLSKTIDFELLDISGKVIMLGKNANEIKLSNIKSGIYLVKSSTGEVKKLVVE